MQGRKTEFLTLYLGPYSKGSKPWQKILVPQNSEGQAQDQHPSSLKLIDKN